VAQNDRPAIAGPTIVGSVRRFRRIVIFITAAALIITLFYLVIAPTKYTGKVGIIIVPPPASLTTGASPVHVSAATFNSAQVALIQSNAVAQGAAAIVNSNFSDANLTGPQVQGATAVKLPTAGSTSNQGSTTQILVTLSSPDIAAATANAVASAYLAAVRAQIRQQAGHSISALQAEYNSVQGELKGIPAPTSRSSSNSTSTTTTTHPTTTTTHPPHATTTHAPRATTTRPPRTTTTRPPMTTTTRPPRTTTTRPPRTTTTTQAATSTTAAFRQGVTPAGTTGIVESLVEVVSPAVGDPGASQSLRLTAQDVPVTPGAEPVTTLPAVTANSGTATTSTSSPASSSSSGTSSASSSVTPGSGPVASNRNANNASQRAVLEATLVNLNRQISQIRVNEQIDLAFRPTIFPATAANSPPSGHFWRTVIIGLLVGLFIGVLAAFALASTRRRFEHAEDPSALYGAPLLTTVPAFEAGLWSQVGLPMLTDPIGEAAEAYRSLATILRAQRGETDSILVAVTAADLGAGSTTTVANCGFALAEMGERVLLVDADPLGRSLTQSLVNGSSTPGLHEPPLGLSELLGGRTLAETVVPATRNERMMVLPSGRDSDMAVHRWRTTTLRAALEGMTEAFDVVLIDTPPIGMSSFSLDLIATAEHVMLVIPHYDHVPPHEELARRLPMIRAELLGYVYNGVQSSTRFAPYYPVVRGGPADSTTLGPVPAARSTPLQIANAVPARAPVPAPGDPGEAINVGAASSNVAVQTTDPTPAQGVKPSSDPPTKVEPAVPASGGAPARTPVTRRRSGTDVPDTGVLPVVEPDVGDTGVVRAVPPSQADTGRVAPVPSSSGSDGARTGRKAGSSPGSSQPRNPTAAQNKGKGRARTRKPTGGPGKPPGAPGKPPGNPGKSPN